MAIAKQLGVHEIFICNTSNIDSMRHGRPQTVMFKEAQAGTEKLHNGAIVALLETQQTKEFPELDHVHSIEVKEITGAGAAVGQFIIVNPEINVEQYRRIDNSLAKFGLNPLEPNTTHTAYELQKLDRVEYSLAYFAKLQDEVAAATSEADRKARIEALVTELKAGNVFCNIEDGELAIVTGGATGALRVVSVREQRIPLMMDANHNKLPEAYYMVKLEVVPVPQP